MGKARQGAMPHEKGSKSGTAKKVTETPGHSDGGGSKELCDAARALNSPKKGGLPHN
jgi:hypothetical protein